MYALVSIYVRDFCEYMKSAVLRSVVPARCMVKHRVRCVVKKHRVRCVVKHRVRCLLDCRVSLVSHAFEYVEALAIYE